MSEEDRPEWWRKNAQYKRQLGIPEYEPPRFEDSVYTHCIVESIEEAYDCTIRFVGQNSTYPEDWHVEIDGEPIMQLSRHRDSNGNTVYEIESSAFEEKITDRLTAD